MRTMNRVYIQANYLVVATLAFELPQGKTPNDITRLHVEYGYATLTFKDGSTATREMDNIDPSALNLKYPMSYTVHEIDETPILTENEESE